MIHYKPNPAGEIQRNTRKQIYLRSGGQRLDRGQASTEPCYEVELVFVQTEAPS